MSDLQEGIYYKQGDSPGNSCIVGFIRIAEGSTAREVADTLTKIWKAYNELKSGKLVDIVINERHFKPGNLSILIGYGSKIFTLDDIKKALPTEYAMYRKFNDPRPEGGGSLFDNSHLSYGKDIVTNHAASDQLVLQFIGDSEFITSRALVETWKILSSIKNSHDNYIMHFSRVYTGFQPSNQRNWLGFHDGISNMDSNDRLNAIAINQNQLKPEDYWISNGIYLAFMRIEIDLCKWQLLNQEHQEISIGREKITGCPIIDIDKSGHPVKDPDCPVRGTFEIIEKGNERFREFNIRSGKLSYYGIKNSYEKLLESSHIARTRNLNRSNQLNREVYRIYRQGFDFFEQTDHFPGFRVGLNFISFQKSISNLFKIISGFSGKNLKFPDIEPLENILLVRSAGIFLVPPKIDNEFFPGEAMFGSSHAKGKTFPNKYRPY